MRRTELNIHGKSRQPSLIAAVSLLIALASSLAAAAEQVTVTLKDRAEVAAGRVCLGSIAEIKTPSAAMRVRLTKLDLATLESDSEGLVITDRQILARLVIDGVPGDQIVINGSKETQVVRRGITAISTPAASASQDSAILEQVAIQLSMAWLVPIDDIEVRLMVSNASPSQPGPPSAIPEIELPENPDPGRIAVKVRWVDGDQILRIDPLTIEVRLRQTVLLAAASIPRGGVLDPKLLIEDRRLLSSRVTPISLEESAGRSARRALAPGDIVAAKDLAGEGARSTQVKVRDIVRVTARKGSLKVTMQAAEALQSGRVGDLIRVRNTQSNRIVTGRVVSPREVEITLD